MAKIVYGPNIAQISASSFDIGVEEKRGVVDSDNIFLKDMAQSRYFTLTLDKLRHNGKPIQFKLATPSSADYANYSDVHVFNDFFPVKNMTMNFTAYDNLSIPFAIFGNLSILHRKRLTTITINAYDTDKDIVEEAVQKWEAECFPSSKYVAYMADVASKFEYKSYDVTGKINYIKTLYVIPAEGVSVSRGYDDNSEKIVSFSVVAVGEIGASANGSSGNISYPGSRGVSGGGAGVAISSSDVGSITGGSGTGTGSGSGIGIGEGEGNGRGYVNYQETVTAKLLNVPSREPVQNFIEIWDDETVIVNKDIV